MTAGNRTQSWPIAPVRLPRVRDKLAWYWGDDGPAAAILARTSGVDVNLPGADVGEPGVFARTVEQPGPQASRSFCQRIAGAVADADLYWISQEFTDLAVEAAAHLPDLTFQAEEMPSETGLVIWQSPVHSIAVKNDTTGLVPNAIDVVAATWFTVGGGVWVTGYGVPDAMMRSLPRSVLLEKFGWLHPVAPGGGARFGTYETALLPGGTGGMLGVLLSTWFLIRQPGVADAVEAPADKQLRKAYAKAGRRWPEVRVINLRRRPTPEPPEATDTATEGGGHQRRSPQVRFRVKGHWRDQPYGPGRAYRHRRYIASFVKGPAGAPWKPAKTDTVKALR